MSRDLLVAMARRTLAHTIAGTQPLAADTATIDAATYVDEDRWNLELDRIFRRVPIVIGASAEIAEPGDHVATTVVGTPVLVVRGADRRLRAFVNMCSHRGAIVVADGFGRGRRFACPYHAWTYDEQGALVGIRGRERFGDVDPADLGLTPLACEERAGLVFVCLRPGQSMDLDAHLHGYDDLLAHHGLADGHVVGRQELDGPNWKVAFDGYIDQYHLPVLHRDGFGDDYCDRAVYDAWGPHQRMSPPDKRFLVLQDLPEDEWPTEVLLGGVWTVFPNVSIASFVLDPVGDETQGRRLTMISQMFPGEHVGSSRTVQTFVMRDEPTDDHLALVREMQAFLIHVVRDQDYHTGHGIQLAAATGAKPQFVFGRNELGGQRFHRWVDDLVAAADDEAHRTLMARAEVSFQP